MDEEILNEDLASEEYILRNISLARDCFVDISNCLKSRREISALISQQVQFYVFLLLRGYDVLKRSPTILIFGSGQIGTRIVNDLCEVGCSQHLRIYTRGDEGSKYWKSRGLRASTSIPKLLNGEFADIVIISSPLASFSAMARLLSPAVTLTSAVIFCTLGLQRRRLLSMLKCPTIFRTYQEPVKFNTRLLTPFLEHSDTAPLVDKSETRHEGEGNESDEDDEDDEDIKVVTKNEAEILNMEKQALEAEELLHLLDSSPWNSSPVDLEYAADLIAIRSIDVRYIIYVLENFYALLGMTHPQARYEAMVSVLNYRDSEFESYKANRLDFLFPSIMQDSYNNNNNFGASEGHNSSMDSKSLPVLNPPFMNMSSVSDNQGSIAMVSSILFQLTSRLASTIQLQLSKHILIMQLPKLTTITKKLDDLRNVQESIQAAILSNAESLENEEDEEVLAQAVDFNPMIGVDGAFESMHSHDTLLKIYDQDRKYKNTLGTASSTIVSSVHLDMDEDDDGGIDFLLSQTQDDNDDND